MEGNNDNRNNNKNRKQIRRIRVGDCFGTLVVVKDLGFNAKTREHYYMCRCTECGTEKQINRRYLIKPDVVCRNCREGNKHKGKIVDGYVVEKMTNKRNSSRNVIWLCKCIKCGRKKEIPSNNISSGKMPKCDCSLFTLPMKSFAEQWF